MLALALFLSLVLAVAAAHKALHREQMVSATARLTETKPAIAAMIGIAAAGLEAVAALALLLPDTRSIGAGIAAVLWVGYGLALMRRLGETLDCSCDFGSKAKPVGLFAVSRAFALAVLGVMLVLLPSAPLTPDAPFAALAFFALYVAAGLLADNMPASRRIST